MTNKVYFVFVGLFIILAAFFLLKPKGGGNDLILSSQTPAPPASASISPTNSGNNFYKPKGTTLPPLTAKEIGELIEKGNGIFYYYLTKPATCQVGGEIDFLTPTIAEIKNAKISYTGIDNQARQIKWVTAPSDEIKVSPNLAASLELPDGESVVGANLPAEPKAKSYILTASITYGRLVNGAVVSYEAKCSGQISLVLKY